MSCLPIDTSYAQACGGDIPSSVWKEKELEIRLWASLRGQTLARTISGVMQFEKAALLFAKQEWNFAEQQTKQQTNLDFDGAD
eukprot:SAG25_NODE_2286_length_1753_cov_1.524788_2_plen_83_part_00